MLPGMNCGSPMAPAYDPITVCRVALFAPAPQQQLFELFAKEGRAVGAPGGEVEAQRGQRIERAKAAHRAAVEGLDADDADDDLRWHAPALLGLLEPALIGAPEGHAGGDALALDKACAVGGPVLGRARGRRHDQLRDFGQRGVPAPVARGPRPHRGRGGARRFRRPDASRRRAGRRSRPAPRCAARDARVCALPRPASPRRAVGRPRRRRPSTRRPGRPQRPCACTEDSNSSPNYRGRVALAAAAAKRRHHAGSGRECALRP